MSARTERFRHRDVLVQTPSVQERRFRFPRNVLALTLTLAALAACDGDSSNVAGDASAPKDGAATDRCVADGTRCTNADNGTGGLCRAGVCAACVDRVDDLACGAAYGSGVLCSGAACVPGTCHTSDDCDATATSAGKVCVSNTCAACSRDVECAGDSHYAAQFGALAGAMCNASSGKCVSAACIVKGVACNAGGNTNGSASDFCCPFAAGNACFAGNCCANTDCATGLSCVAHTCTACPAVTANAYYVDPVWGADDARTGAASCPFRTIGRALAAIGAAPAGTRVAVVASGILGADETFPITVPANVTVTSAQPKAATIRIAAGQHGFVLANPDSGLANLILDGSNNKSASGILVIGGSHPLSTRVDHVRIRDTGGDGILVTSFNTAKPGGQLTIDVGTFVTRSGTSTARASGLHVANNGVAIVHGGGPDGSPDHTSFVANSLFGIYVTETGQVLVDGPPIASTAPAAAYVDADGNAFAGLTIEQTVGQNPTSTIRGLRARASGAGNGIRIGGGSWVALRGCYANGNAANGLALVTSPTFSVDLSHIDVGTDTGANAGRNTLQGPLNGEVNAAAGICLAITPYVGQTLVARGNILGATDCVANPAPLTHAASCAGKVAIGGVAPKVNSNTVVVDGCIVQ